MVTAKTYIELDIYEKHKLVSVVGNQNIHKERWVPILVFCNGQCW